MRQPDEGTQIEAFLAGAPFAVVGASTHRAKYGNKILRCYQQNERRAIPINPRVTQIEGAEVYSSLSLVPEPIHGVSIITPPQVTETVMDEVIELGIRHVWMQPGAESARALEKAREAGVNCIAGGACLLVVLGYRERVF
ncbi:MAG: CoA-binding protein [Myxococcota bacterium]|nr:CoA-binding protein [Myxococcota bacterium]